MKTNTKAKNVLPLPVLEFRQRKCFWQRKWWSCQVKKTSVGVLSREREDGGEGKRRKCIYEWIYDMQLQILFSSSALFSACDAVVNIYISLVGTPHGMVVNVLDCDIVVRIFNAIISTSGLILLGKLWTLLTPHPHPALRMGLVSLLFFYKDGFGIK